MSIGEYLYQQDAIELLERLRFDTLCDMTIPEIAALEAACTLRHAIDYLRGFSEVWPGLQT
jgi:hypothetical protein